MLSNINDQDDLQKNFMNIQLIFTACLKELIRQVSIHCSERGTLIQRIWDEYLDIVEKAIIFEQKQNNKNETLQIKEITRIHALYEAEINNMTSRCNTTMNHLETMKNDLEKMKNERNYAVKILLNSRQKSLELQDAFDCLRRDYDKLLTENHNLKLISDETSSPTSLRISKAKNSKLIDLPAPRQRKSWKFTNSVPIIGSSIVSHLLEFKEKEQKNDSNFAKKETIEILTDKKKIFSTLTTPLSLFFEKIISEKINRELTKEQKIEDFLGDSAEMQIFELIEIGVDTEELNIMKDQEIMTDIQHTSKDFGKKRQSVDVETTDDFSVLKENCIELESIIEDLMTTKSEKEHLINVTDSIINKVKTLVSKNNKNNFKEGELISLKEQNTKLKIEINEMMIERDQFKEFDQGKEKDILELMTDYKNVKLENKILKKDMSKFQSTIDNSIRKLFYEKIIYIF